MWGGEKLKTILNKVYDEEQIGESWELSQVPGDISVVSGGEFKGINLTELIEQFKGELVGEKVFEKFGTEFPLLIKYIDAKTPLSIQVHPDNETARERHNSFGKNEMWYVMQADSKSELIVGWDKPLDRESYLKSLKEGSILEFMHHEHVAQGDTFYIPTGRVHAIGAGVMLAEIQQTSDVTYRVYDYDRVDAKTGQKRELHVEESVEVMDFEIHENYKTDYYTQKNKSEKLVHSSYFTTNIIDLDKEMKLDLSERDSFTIFMTVEGNATINGEKLGYGETILIPNALNQLTILGSGKLLEVSI
ncbi:class I mannose-6-phosphate isomerase [Flavobacteriaceae bacterium]|nr:class I mannose-6-phosphate isomerase [Flavobacteriaceae bacterium]